MHNSQSISILKSPESFQKKENTHTHEEANLAMLLKPVTIFTFC